MGAGTVRWYGGNMCSFPERSGKMTIPSIKFEGIVVQQNRNIDPIDAFFNGGSTMVEVKKTIVAPSLTLQVRSFGLRHGLLVSPERWANSISVLPLLRAK